jgi:hypothetical protein
MTRAGADAQVPPAMTRASSPYFSIKLKAFLRVVGSW